MVAVSHLRRDWQFKLMVTRDPDQRAAPRHPVRGLPLPTSWAVPGLPGKVKQPTLRLLQGDHAAPRRNGRNRHLISRVPSRESTVQERAREPEANPHPFHRRQTRLVSRRLSRHPGNHRCPITWVSPRPGALDQLGLVIRRPQGLSLVSTT